MNIENEDTKEYNSLPETGKVSKVSRGALQAIGGEVPFAGGIFSAISGA